jgi:hypothetical protein
MKQQARPSEEEYPYTTLSVAEAMQTYTKIDPKYIYLKLDRADEGYRMVMIANHPDGPKEIGHTGWYPLESDAVKMGGDEVAVVAILNADGEYEYPYFDEKVAKIKQDARDRRAAIKKLNELIVTSKLIGS